MSIQFTPSRRFAWTRLVLAIAAMSLSATPSRAQVPKARPAPPAPNTSEPATDVTAADVEATLPQQGELEERYNDPRAAAVLQNHFPELFTDAQPLRGNDARRLEEMIAGRAAPDRALLTSFIRYQLRQLSRPQNIQAILDPAAPPRNVEAYEQLGEALRQPVVTNSNPNFRATYAQAMVPLADDVLKNQLYPRLIYLTALNLTRDQSAIPVYSRVLQDPQQPLTVKILACVGLTEMAQNGRVDIPPQQAKPAARAVADFLEKEPDTFWPAQYRGLEALGSLRQSSTDPLNPKADLAAVALRFLADPDAHPTVRAWAAWALGMMRPSSRNEELNFSLIAHHMGQAAASFGAKIVEIQESNPQRAMRLTDLLFQTYLGLVGTDDIRDAGLLKTEHPAITAQRATIQRIANGVRAVLAAAVELTRGAPQQWPGLRAALAARVEELRSSLNQSPPSSLSLVPQGPQFPLADASATGPQA